ncbi:MAG TPA: hypothetical protein ENH50_11520, partial [Nitrospirae bacterium]|nr:hypothetical protein [Nitrospirota bacterium]
MTGTTAQGFHSFPDLKERYEKAVKAGEEGRAEADCRRKTLCHYLSSPDGRVLFLIGFKPIQDVIDLNGLYTGVIVFLTSKILCLVNIKTSIEGSIIRLPS